MNTTKAAAAMMAKANGRNISFDMLVDRALALTYVPMVAPQKDGNYTVVRVYRGDDEMVMDLTADAAQALLADWIGAVVLLMPNAKVEARWQASIAANGWAD